MASCKRGVAKPRKFLFRGNPAETAGLDKKVAVGCIIAAFKNYHWGEYTLRRRIEGTNCDEIDEWTEEMLTLDLPGRSAIGIEGGTLPGKIEVAEPKRLTDAVDQGETSSRSDGYSPLDAHVD